MSIAVEKFGRRTRVLNTPCTETSYSELTQDLVCHCAELGGRALAVDFTNVHIVAMRDCDPEFHRLTESMDLFVPDSSVLTWAVNWRGGDMPDRVYGPAFLSYVIEHSPSHLRHYFLGASQDCLDKLLGRIRERNPDFKIVGSRNGYFQTEDEEDILEGINEAKADLVWIGLGTPKQQEWISRFRDRVKAGALLAVGFAFDVNAGTKKDAPAWMQGLGLTWAYRLADEPGRLWKRYLVYNSIFLKGLSLQRLREGKPVQEAGPGDPCQEAASDEIAIPPHQEGPPRCNVLGVGISAMNLNEATGLVVERSDASGRTGYVTITGVHGVMESRRDPELQKIHNRSFLSTPDGMPMVWIGKWMGYDEIDRVYGPDLMLKVVQGTAGSGRGHYFFGGSEGVADSLAERLQQQSPGVRVVGTQCPPYRELTAVEEQELVKDLQETRPHFLWVGLSTPKQERFMHDFLERNSDLTKDWDHGLVLLGVGAAFDFHSGRVRQAPRWMQRKGLEWFFRVCMEPRRLWKRYSINNTGFIFSIFPQLMDIKHYPLEK